MLSKYKSAHVTFLLQWLPVMLKNKIKLLTMAFETWQSLALAVSQTPSFWMSALCVLSHFSHVWISKIQWTIVAHQTPLSMGFSWQEYWNGLPCPPPGDLPHPGIEPLHPCLLHWQTGSSPLAPPGKPLHINPCIARADRFKREVTGWLFQDPTLVLCFLSQTLDFSILIFFKKML